MRKDIFIDGYEQSNIIKDCKNFLTKMKYLKSYMVNLEENSAIKNKINFSDYAVHSLNCQSILIITHNKYKLSANDKI